MNKNFGLILPLILIFAAFIKADVPPDPGFKRVSINLIVETKEDLSDYRFFLDFYGDMREVEIRQGSNSLPANGGGARYSSGTLWAIPKKSLKDETKEQISKALNENKIVGAIKLAQHQFAQTVRDSETDKIQNPPYIIERDVEKGLKIIRQGGIVNQGGKGSGIDFSVYGISKSLTIPGYLVLIGFPTAAIVILGIWLFRRKGRKLG